jgi:hypothetical protein
MTSPPNPFGDGCATRDASEHRFGECFPAADPGNACSDWTSTRKPLMITQMRTLTVTAGAAPSRPETEVAGG